jgi:DMSO reductase family type II enzyme chaperone
MTTQATDRSVIGRDVESTAPGRCACYAALSELLASPHDLDPRPSLRDRIGVGATVAHAGALDPLLTEFVDMELASLKREYSGLFEVGNDGPPVPIREDLQTGQRGGTREDIVRFYSFFGYRLDDKFAWAPDHLSVELEFMHFLCYRESVAEPGEPTGALSYQLAQYDFSTRHLVNWVPTVAHAVAASAPDSLYARVLAAGRDFVCADHAWQASTVVESDSDKNQNDDRQPPSQPPFQEPHQ